jgi:hypothetical protein
MGQHWQEAWKIHEDRIPTEESELDATAENG